MQWCNTVEVETAVRLNSGFCTEVQSGLAAQQAHRLIVFAGLTTEVFEMRAQSVSSSLEN